MNVHDHPSLLARKAAEDVYDGGEYVTIDQLRHLVRLIDQSDIVEIEVKQSGKHTRLLLRKARSLPDHSTGSETPALLEEAADPVAKEPYTITAPTVGVFQRWSTSKDKPLVAVGDVLKARQHIGVIRSLNIPNEVEAPVAGRVIDILVEDGQRIEYGQPLMTIEQQS